MFSTDAMKIGGNKNAQAFFRKHGMTDMHVKIEKKYTSKAAQAYKSELGKLVDAEAAKRGESTPVADLVDQSSDLLANLDLAEKSGMDEAARARRRRAFMIFRPYLCGARVGRRRRQKQKKPQSRGQRRCAAP